MAGRGRQRVGRPRIYGDETKCRAAIKRYIADGQELLDQAAGVRNRFAQAKAERAKTKTKPTPRPAPKPRATATPATTEPALPPLIELKFTTVELSDGEWLDWIARDWIQSVRSWHERALPRMRAYLQEQVDDLLPTFASGPVWPCGARRNRFSVDNAEPWLHEALAELREMQAALGVHRAIAPSPPAPTKFAELLASGLVEPRVIKDQTKSMTTPLRTSKQLEEAIGAAKELTEATLRGALIQLGKPSQPKDDLPTLMKVWRHEVGQIAPAPKGADMLASALNAEIRLLAEWRNKYGRGHGRPNYPAGVKPRHARLVADTAETCIRFIVSTMDDLQLLPP